MALDASVRTLPQPEGPPLVDARSLHGWLGNRHGFTKWLGERIEQYGFQLDVDFWAVSPETPSIGRPRREYHLTLDMAKELAMVERTAIGRATRRYFIQMEKAANDMARTLVEQGQAEALKAGEELLQVKKSLPHGQFGDWCRDNLSFDERTAQRYMKLAKSDMRVGFDPTLSINATLEALSEKQPRISDKPVLDKDTAERLLKLCRLANSPNENEALVAQQMADKLAAKFGMTGEEGEAAARKLCPEPPSHDDMVRRAR